MYEYYCTICYLYRFEWKRTLFGRWQWTGTIFRSAIDIDVPILLSLWYNRIEHDRFPDDDGETYDAEFPYPRIHVRVFIWYTARNRVWFLWQNRRHRDFPLFFVNYYYFFLRQKQQNNNITYCTVRIHHPPSKCVQENATVATAGPARPVYADTEKKKLKNYNAMYKLYVHNNTATQHNRTWSYFLIIHMVNELCFFLPSTCFAVWSKVSWLSVSNL